MLTAAVIGGVTITVPRILPTQAAEFRRSLRWRVGAAAPDRLSGKVQQSIVNAQEACAEDPVSGECAAAWDEVEELSAAASHAKVKENESDPLENYCKDNPESDECRTYDN